MINRIILLVLVAQLLGACAVVIKEGGIPVPPVRPKEFSK